MQVEITPKTIKTVSLIMTEEEAMMLSRILGQIGIHGNNQSKNKDVVSLRDFIAFTWTALKNKDICDIRAMPPGTTISTL